MSMAAAIFVSGTSLAMPITGEIHFVGTFNPKDGTGLGDAKGLSFDNPNFVLVATGSFADIAPWATFNSFSFAPFAPVDPLWSAGGFSFNLQSINVDLQSDTQLNLSGIGLLTGPGYDPTVANWNFQGGGGAKFSFRADDVSSGLPGVVIDPTPEPEPNGEPVPDSGNPALLLGVALMGLGACRIPRFAV